MHNNDFLALLSRLRFVAGRLERYLEGAFYRAREGRPIVSREDLIGTRIPGGGSGGSDLVSRQAGSRERPAPEGESILYLPALSWSQRFQRPQQLARAMAEQGFVTLYVDPFRTARLSPAVWLSEPLPRLWRVELKIRSRLNPYAHTLDGELADRLAKRLLGLMTSAPRLIVMQLPFWLPLGLALRDRVQAPLMYDCIDYHRAFPNVDGDDVASNEKHAILNADLISASSRTLLGHVRSLGREAEVIPNGVDLGDIPLSPKRSRETIRVGYVGALTTWFDVESVRFLAQMKPSFRFILAGRVECEHVRSLDRLQNVKLLGEIAYQQIPQFLSDLDAVLIPFRDQPLTRAVDAVKLYEALAAGLPVIAPALPEFERWPEECVYLWRTREELPGKLDQALHANGDAQRVFRRDFVRNDTWASRARTLLDLGFHHQ